MKSIINENLSPRVDDETSVAKCDGPVFNNALAEITEKHESEIKKLQDKIDAANATLKVLTEISNIDFPGTTYENRVCTPSIKVTDGKLEEIIFAWNRAPSSSSYTWVEREWVAACLTAICLGFGPSAIGSAKIKVTVDDTVFRTSAQAEKDALKHMEIVINGTIFREKFALESP